MSSSNMGDSSRAEAIKELEYSIANWKIYVFEVEYKDNFGLWDRRTYCGFLDLCFIVSPSSSYAL